jgi:hypothetical protein
MPKEARKEFGADIDWEPVIESPNTYCPTRLEYFAGKALAGLLTGQSLKNHDAFIRKSVLLAAALEKEIDEHNS